MGRGEEEEDKEEGEEELGGKVGRRESGKEGRYSKEGRKEREAAGRAGVRGPALGLLKGRKRDTVSGRGAGGLLRG